MVRAQKSPVGAGLLFGWGFGVKPKWVGPIMLAQVAGGIISAFFEVAAFGNKLFGCGRGV